MILNDFKQKIAEDINNSNLTIDAIYYVLKDIFNEVAMLYEQQLQREQSESTPQADIPAEEVESEKKDEKKEA
jgi:hypothetical protein